MSTSLDRVREHLLEHSIKRGQFTLKSGRSSNLFVDSKMTICAPEVMVDLAQCVLEKIPSTTTAIGGLTMGADGVAYITAAVAATQGRLLRAFSVRKETKDHGAGGRIAGLLLPLDNVVITEDTVTRGRSLIEAADVVEAAGGRVLGLLSVVDRGGAVAAIAKARGYEFWTLFSAPDLGFEYEGA